MDVTIFAKNFFYVGGRYVALFRWLFLTKIVFSKLTAWVEVFFIFMKHALDGRK